MNAKNAKCDGVLEMAMVGCCAVGSHERRPRKGSSLQAPVANDDWSYATLMMHNRRLVCHQTRWRFSDSLVST